LKKEAMDKEIAKIKAEYEEKQKKKAKKKDKDAKEKEKKVDDDDEKERDDKVWRSKAFRARLTYLLADQVYHRQNRRHTQAR
jgi:hypothetical protein